MQFQNAAIALLAGMIFVLASLVGWLYWQQTRIHQSLNTLAMVLAEMAPQPMYEESAPELKQDEEPEEEASKDTPADSAEVVSGPPDVDVDDVSSKSRKELHDLLTKKGIPFGKGDSKNVLVQLLKASS